MNSRRVIVILLGFGIALSAFPFSQPASDQFQEKLLLARMRSAFASRWAKLAGEGMRFDAHWVPLVELGEPYIEAQMHCYGIEYRPKTGDFLVSRILYRTKVANSEGIRLADAFAREIDHALGHAYFDQMYRRTGHGPWPGWQDLAGMPRLQKREGIILISEGFARSFAEMDISPEYRVPCDSPEYDATSFGGLCLVRPILREAWIGGMLYLADHPFAALPGESLKSAVKAYQERALKALAAENK